MFKQLFEFVRQSLFLQRDVRELKDDVAHLERELHATNEAVRQLAIELQRINEREIHERDKFTLKIENILLRHERALSAPKDARRKK